MKTLSALSLAFATLLLGQSVNLMAAEKARQLTMPSGIQFGDLDHGNVMVWSRSNRDARMYVEYSVNEDFTNSTVVRGPYALGNTDHTAKLELIGLPLGKDVFVKVWFEDLSNQRVKSKPLTGHFHTISNKDDIRFVWGGDTAGQGWGINLEFGGMKIYEAMRKVNPQFFHS
ncbi:PhoD-like phosphatase N-terminal domain-containing protein [Methylocucumis oryzae]|uniref:PhoD-like phosphatase N-terminal domain-containing protein n=1 Tax=Methylocucumis oryzae TaxID=1632867 RepID=UPI000AEFB45D|nr:PhoD-like phosphatase N-terminal domain-containing protein [Methylocucumis oryzae]